MQRPANVRDVLREKGSVESGQSDTIPGGTSGRCMLHGELHGDLEIYAYGSRAVT
jgi:hypothetical protein